MFFDDQDKEALLDGLGEIAALPNGAEFYIIPGELVQAVTEVAPDGDVIRVLPDGLMSSADIEKHGIVDGDSGTVVTFLGRQCRIIALVAKANGFSHVQFGDV